jgi:hypothetical protein
MLAYRVATAKCVTATVVVEGNVPQLMADAGMQVEVTLQTSKGDYSNTVPLSDGHFSAEVRFSTSKSASILGDNCSNLPKVVVISVRSGAGVLSAEKVPFKSNFHAAEIGRYLPNRPFSISVKPAT